MYSLFTDPTRGAGIFNDHDDLPSVAESWRRLIPEDARMLGKWVVKAAGHARQLGERMLQLGSAGKHAGLPERVTSQDTPAGRHSAEHIEAQGKAVVYAAELIAALAADDQAKLVATR